MEAAARAATGALATGLAGLDSLRSQTRPPDDEPEPGKG